MVDYRNNIIKSIPVAIQSTKLYFPDYGMPNIDVSSHNKFVQLLDYFYSLLPLFIEYNEIGQTELDLVTKVSNKCVIFYRNIRPTDELIVKETQIVLIADLEDSPFDMLELIGLHNKKVFQHYAFKQGTGHKVIIPFEIVASFRGAHNNNSLSEKDYASININDPRIIHFIQPSPIIGIARDNNIDNISGYVVNPVITANIYLNKNDQKEINALEYDTQAALKLLKCRYSVNINQSVIDSISKLDSDISKHPTGKIVVDIRK